jgi:hypothetical protein
MKLLVSALRMALRNPRSVGQRGLSMVLGNGAAHAPTRRRLRRRGA